MIKKLITAIFNRELEPGQIAIFIVGVMTYMGLFLIIPLLAGLIFSLFCSYLQ